MANTYEVEWESGAKGGGAPKIDVTVARERSRVSVSLRRPFSCADLVNTRKQKRLVACLNGLRFRRAALSVAAGISIQ